MTKQEKAVVNMAKFLQAQSLLLLLEKLNELNSDKLDAETNLCEELHEHAESLHQQLSAKVGGELALLQ
uniref:Rom n=1 Tax=Proteus vulgaris TaxID=585 RepID=Q52624_PROVU|nr:Rop family plasmid primer RNA-binding protein [Proteus vulgaris]AAG42420.1 Rom [Proteus vulgaris]